MKKQKTKSLASIALDTGGKAKPLQSLSRSKNFAFLLIVFFLPFLLYFNTLKFGFTHFDDDGLIVSNSKFLGDFKNAPKVFVTDAFITKISPFYRPLQSLSYMTDMQLSGGANPWMFHLSNVLLLACIGVLLFILILRFHFPPLLALLSTLLYSVHPLFVSSIAWIPARGDLLLVLFSLSSFISLIDYLAKKRFVFLFTHLLSFALALFSKETAAFLPVLFIAYYLIYIHKGNFDKKLLLNVVLYLAIGLGWYLLRAKSIGDFSNRDDVFGLSQILSNLPTIPESITKFFIPFDNAPIPSFSMLKTSLGLLLIGMLSMLIFIRDGFMKQRIFFLLWFFLLVSPTMLFKHELIEYLDHRFFLPLIGILFLILYSIPKHWMEEMKFSWSVGIIVLVFGVITFNKSVAYASPMAYYNEAVQGNSKSAIAYNNRGSEKNTKGDYVGAIKDFDAAIAIYPQYAKAYTNRGYAKSSANDKQGALVDLDYAISLNRNEADPYYYRGNAYLGLGKFNEAIKDFDQFISMRPTIAEAYNYKGMAIGSTGNVQEAINNFTKAIELNPNYTEAYGNRYVARFYLKDYAGAIADCEMVLKMKPNDARTIQIKAEAIKALQK